MKKPMSFLEVEGAKDVGVEGPFHVPRDGIMIGWRIGWVCGNELIVRAFADVKGTTATADNSLRSRSRPPTLSTDGFDS